MNSLEKSMSDQLKQHTTEIDVLRKEKTDVTKDSLQLKQDYEKSQTACKEFEMKFNIAQESITNLKSDLKNKVKFQYNYFQHFDHKASIRNFDVISKIELSETKF